MNENLDKENTEKEEVDFSSVFSTSMVNILQHIKSSIIVSTYQSGKVIILREDGGLLNTHFKSFNRPMGIAVKPNRVAIGCFDNIHKYYNIPHLIEKLDEPEKYDACYVPRNIHITGEIDIHEMAWTQEDKLWFVNTEFSCLCTLDSEHSFRPQWRPEFISGWGVGDCCHLNGLGMKDGKPQYVTMLGETDSLRGWRENKRDGGLLIDIQSNNVISRGLSMPHSPRWHDNKIWFLESGYGSLAYINPDTGCKTTVTKLPGFTRGLDFVGNLAFIGLSKVRETAVFSDFPLLEELKERTCGVYVVDISNGQLLGFVKFEGSVEEIFSVQILNNHTYPEILEVGDENLHNCYVIPDKCLKDVKTS